MTQHARANTSCSAVGKPLHFFNYLWAGDVQVVGKPASHDQPADRLRAVLWPKRL